jgi:hypothetical protein
MVRYGVTATGFMQQAQQPPEDATSMSGLTHQFQGLSGGSRLTSGLSAGEGFA